MMKAKNVVITFVATVRFGWLSRDFFTAFECLCIMTLHQVTRGKSCLGRVQLS